MSRENSSRKRETAKNFLLSLWERAGVRGHTAELWREKALTPALSRCAGEGEKQIMRIMG